MKHTKETYQKVINEQHLLDIELVEFSGTTKPASFKYNCCGTIKNLAQARGILKSKSCPGCSPQYNAHTPEYVQNNILDPLGIHLISEYRHEKTPVEVRFSCGCIATKTISALKAGNGTRCLECNDRFTDKGKEAHRLSLQEVNLRLASAPYGSYTLTEEYLGVDNHTDIKCLNCSGTIYRTTVANLLKRRTGCPICNSKPQKSVKEMYIRQILTDMEVKYYCEYPLGPYKLDFFLPEKSLAIEFDGEHHDLSEKRKDMDRSKDTLIADSGYSLLRLHHKDKNIVSTIINKIKEGATTIPQGSTLK
jgi:very-short-patch-repair endonuclease